MINKRFFKTKDEVEVTFELPEDQVGQAVGLMIQTLINIHQMVLVKTMDC